jgi:hypothetical protein
MPLATSDRFLRAFPAIVGAVLFAVALEELRVELRSVSRHGLTHDIRNTPVPQQLLLAVVFTVLS